MRKKRATHSEPIHGNKGATRSKGHNSILNRHEEKLALFDKKEDRLKSIDARIKTLNREIDKTKKDRSYKQLNQEESYDACIKINRLETELQNIESEKVFIASGEDVVNYLLDSSWIINDFITLQKRETELLSIQDPDEHVVGELNDIMKRKGELTDSYLIKFDPEYVSVKKTFHTESSICDECNEYYQVDSGFLICPECGKCVTNGVETTGDLSYKEMQDYDCRPQFTYDKLSHLEDWLRRFQAKENRTIPQEVLDKVVLEAKKERIKDLGILTEEKVKKYLKKLELNEYYDNVIGIINRINGRPPFNLTPEIENKVKMMFQQIRAPFENHKPKGRKNFLSYSYTLHKFFQILGLHEFAKYFPLLKSADKLRQQDEIFKKIVAEMAEKDKSIKWVFYPSI